MNRSSAPIQPVPAFGVIADSTGSAPRCVPLIPSARLGSVLFVEFGKYGLIVGGTASKALIHAVLKLAATTEAGKCGQIFAAMLPTS